MLFDSPDTISVSALNRMARELLEHGLPPMWISGEVSNLTLAASGHAYFSLKDAGAQVRCVMFRHRLSQLDFRPREGMQVEVRGTVTLYEARGDYQINLDTMRQAGLGRLFEAFERLKARLEAEGLFANARKRPLPEHPRAIGVVTSPAAAALRDVVTTLRRRMPSIPVVLYPTPVQGADAARQIAAAIATAGQRCEVDVLIVCRGGGSIEDLWSFNEEAVARAVAACPIPVVSGVGHETDFTICDFVADRRAPTPTAAAELVSPSRDALQGQLDLARRHLGRALARLLIDKGQRLDYLARRLAHPGERLAQQRQALQRAETRLAALMHGRLERGQWKVQLAAERLGRVRPRPLLAAAGLDAQAQRLRQALGTLLQGRARQLERCHATLEALNPHAVLSRGYAIVQKTGGHAVKSPAELLDHERVTLLLAEGSTEALIDHPKGTQPELPF